MPKYIPPSLRKDSKVFVPGIKSKIPGKEEFPPLTKDTSKIPSRQLGSWGIGINPETLKSLKDKKNRFFKNSKSNFITLITRR